LSCITSKLINVHTVILSIHSLMHVEVLLYLSGVVGLTALTVDVF